MKLGSAVLVHFLLFQVLEVLWGSKLSEFRVTAGLRGVEMVESFGLHWPEDIRVCGLRICKA